MLCRGLFVYERHVKLWNGGCRLAFLQITAIIATCYFGDAQVAQLWEDASRLAEVGQAAVQKARSWTELANASWLLTLVDNMLEPSM